MRMFRQEQEEDGVAIDPIKAVHTVKVDHPQWGSPPPRTDNPPASSPPPPGCACVYFACCPTLLIFHHSDCRFSFFEFPFSGFTVDVLVCEVFTDALTDGFTVA